MALPSKRLGNSSISSLDFINNVEDSHQPWSLPLYQALNLGNWEGVEAIIRQEPAAIRARLTPFAETPLLVAVKAGQRLPFLQKLLDFMLPEALTLIDYFGNTALHAVAVLGDIDAAKLFVRKNGDLPNIWNMDGWLPIHLAAMRGHRDMTLYLFKVTREDGILDSHNNAAGATLVHFAVTAGLYDLALYLVEHNPTLAWKHDDLSPLQLLAQEPSAFPSGMGFSFWELLIYHCVPMKLIEMPESLAGAMKTPRSSSFKLPRRCRNQLFKVFQQLHVVLWKVLETFVVHVKHIRHTKAMHHQAIRLTKRVCSEIKGLDNAKASSIIMGPFLLGAQNGIHEIVKEILECFPHAITFINEDNHSVFHIAVMYRHEKIFKTAHQKSGQYKMNLSLLLDGGKNNILHLAAYRAYQDRLDVNHSAVLRMQRELQWYKEVEKFVLPQERKSKNADGKTPLTIFNEEHRDLAAYETQWMIGMATSCTVAASLIATVAFAAAITLPGGNDESNGLPLFYDKKPFIVFIISDALALLSSVTTMLSFLSLFTSRYSVSDFLYSLPNRLIIGLVSLFVSVTCLMMAFSCTLFLVAARSNVLVLMPIVALGCVPVGMFAYLQLPPLVNMITTTYGPSIFE